MEGDTKEEKDTRLKASPLESMEATLRHSRITPVTADQETRTHENEEMSDRVKQEIGLIEGGNRKEL